MAILIAHDDYGCAVMIIASRHVEIPPWNFAAYPDMEYRVAVSHNVDQRRMQSLTLLVLAT